VTVALVNQLLLRVVQEAAQLRVPVLLVLHIWLSLSKVT
jgi:hypothetical protein